MILQDSQSQKIKIVFGPPGTGKTPNLLTIVESELQQGTPHNRQVPFALTKNPEKNA